MHAPRSWKPASSKLTHDWSVEGPNALHPAQIVCDELFFLDEMTTADSRSCDSQASAESNVSLLRAQLDAKQLELSDLQFRFDDEVEKGISRNSAIVWLKSGARPSLNCVSTLIGVCDRSIMS